MVEVFSEIMEIDLRRKVRHQNYVAARYACFLWLRTNTCLSFSNIAEIFDMNHSTVIHGVNEMNIKLSINDAIATEYWNKIKDRRLNDVIKKAIGNESQSPYSLVFTICG